MTILEGDVHKIEGYREFKDELNVTRSEIETALSDDAREAMIEETKEFVHAYDDIDIDDTDDISIEDVPDDIFRDLRDIDDDLQLISDILKNRSGRYVLLFDGMQFFTIVDIDN